MSAKFIIKTRNNGEYDFSLHAPNGQPILHSRGYSCLSACKNGIESVRKNSIYDKQFVRHSNSIGKTSFGLIASNKQYIGHSEMYESVSARENGIMSVMKNASSAIIEDKTKIEVKPNPNIKSKAKEIVNSFYQPLGMIKQFRKLNGKQMWEYAQECAKTQITMKLNNCGALTLKETQELREVFKEIDNV